MNLTFDLSPKKILGIAIALLVVLLVCTYKVNTNPSGFALTGVIFSIAALAVLVMASKIDVVLEVLRDELEPKVGYAPQANPPLTPYPDPSRRDNLNHSLIGSLGICLSNRGMDATGIGEFIRKTADAILGGVPAAKVACTCGPNQGCSNCPTAGLKADQAAEAEIVAAGLTAPRVTAEQIQALMSQLTWRYEQPHGTTSTLAHAYLGRFYLVTGHSACVSPENFDAALGMKYAREQAEGRAREKLWELEGYKLYAGIGAQ